MLIFDTLDRYIERYLEGLSTRNLANGVKRTTFWRRGKQLWVVSPLGARLLFGMITSGVVYTHSSVKL